MLKGRIHGVEWIENNLISKENMKLVKDIRYHNNITNSIIVHLVILINIIIEKLV